MKTHCTKAFTDQEVCQWIDKHPNAKIIGISLSLYGAPYKSYYVIFYQE